MLQKTVLKNGLRIVSEKIPHVRSVSIGIWVGSGSRNESAENNGISHLIEHMMFKGTKKRSAKDIAECIDNIGGQLNAFTGKECTCYYAKTLDSHIDIAMDVLADMFFNSRFSKRDLNIERKVIVEEIGMYEDSPEDLVQDMLSETVWRGNSLGYPILGTKESLESIDREKIREYMDANYIPGNTVISVAGSFDEKKLLELAEKYFGSWEPSNNQITPYREAQFITDCVFREKDTEQTHICMGFKGVENGNDQMYTLLAINNILGGGMSSRLFQKIREKLGLVYSIYSYPSSYSNAGLFTIYAGMSPEQVQKVYDLIRSEIENLIKKGITRRELEKSKEQLKGNFILGLESTSSRMNSIGKSEVLLGRIQTPEEVIEKIDAITMDNVEEVIKTVFNLERMSIAIIGRNGIRQ